MEGHLDDENRGIKTSENASFSMYEVQTIEEPYNDDRCGLLGSTSQGELGICEDHAIQEPYEDALKGMEGFLPAGLDAIRRVIVSAFEGNLDLFESKGQAQEKVVRR
ncbi:hypothetical protein K1719_046428 [Acacia pycnantha]|nr:hypothetical protein K1719_046428 [Acacia pycnantha]